MNQLNAAIETCAVSKRFGRLDAVREVSMSVPRGTTFGLIGLNGAGKSTLLRMLVGLVSPDSGTVSIDGRDVWRERLQVCRTVGYVPDRCTAYPWMRVGEVLEFTRALREGRWNAELVKDQLERGRMDVKQRVQKLSKGTAARLSLILALAHDPSVLILDEPTDGLDPVARDDFLEQVIASAGVAMESGSARTIILSSHSMMDVQRMTDHVGILHDGRMIMQKPTEELVRSMKRVRAVLEEGQKPGAVEGAVLTRLEGRAWTVTVVQPGDAAAVQAVEAAGARVLDVEDLSLDDIFKDVVRGVKAGASS